MIVHPIVSPEDADLLLSRRWYVSGNNTYPCYSVPNGKRWLHRIVLERKLGRALLKGEISDHINRNRFDSRRENLRVVTHQGNSENRRTKNKFRGVTKHKRTGKWQAAVQRKGMKGYIGLFDTPEEAARVALLRRIELGFLNDEVMPS